ncbi:c-type cytochrome [Marinobacterium rhizophilum]|uniref:c-type cytochrome n=1 Tax=Marinobacterium rhizophilum TaxID=420402 RepID=UPI00035EFAAF|nr:c-type cytochrome [Marinobacterium rhizophilum]
MNKFVSALCALGLGAVLVASVQAATNNEKIIERIKPAGSVCMVGDDSCGGAAAASAGSGGRSGEDVYNTKCSACHGTGVLDAPKFGTSDWADRGAKGMETLLANAINGINAMPPRGTCADCSDDEIEGAIQHMLDSAK